MIRLGFNDLRSRMTLMFVSLLLVVQIATLSMIHFLGARMAGEQFQPELEKVEAAIDAMLLGEEGTLFEAARTVARFGSMQRAIAAGDPGAITARLSEQLQRRSADVGLFVDSTGRVQSSTEPLSTADGAVTRGTVLFDAQGRPVLVSLAPIRAGKVEGSIGFGRRIEASLLRAAGTRDGIRLSLMARTPERPWYLVHSTAPPAGSSELERELAAALGPLAILSSFSPFDLREYQNLALHLPSAGGEAVIMVQQSLGTALAPFELLRLVVSWVTAIGMIIFLLGSDLIASSITRPVRQLAQAARRMRHGEYDETIAVRARAELAELAESFEQMRGEIARREEEVRRLAYFDPLTGLANRTLFGSQLREAIAAAQSPGEDSSQRRFAVLLLDLDRFKWVNDTLGHECGDRVLEVAAQRLREALSEAPVIARLGGDEFAVLVSGAGAPVHEYLEAITAAFEPPIAIAQHTVDIGASIGVAHYPEHGSSADELMRHADSAMYTAKRHGLPSAVYDPSLEVSRVRHLSMLSELRAAIERDELALYVQPKVMLAPDAPGALAGEVLVRWDHPDRGLLSAGEFVPFAEQTGFIRQMTLYLLRRAIARSAAWRRAGLEVTLSVNISARDLEDRAFAQRIARWLAAEDLPGRLLCLEVTETALMEEPEHAVDVLRELRAAGVQVSIDDYGTGFSSLAYLKTLWVNELKIDQSFVRAMRESGRDATIVRSTIELGHSLGLRVTAEGVETAEQVRLLREFGCDWAQGHHFSPPMPADEFEQWARRRQPALAQANRPRLQPVAAG